MDRVLDLATASGVSVVLDQLAKCERAKIAERTRRVMLRKAREGRVVVTRPAYGFRYNEVRDAPVLCGPEMRWCRRCSDWQRTGLARTQYSPAFFREGVLPTIDVLPGGRIIYATGRYEGAWQSGRMRWS